MERKIKALFIGIVLSVLFGNLLSNAFVTPEAGVSSFGTVAETLSLYNDVPELEEDLFLESSVPSANSLASTHRQFSKNKRINPSSSLKNGWAISNSKEHKELYISSLFNKSTKRFSSGLIVARLHLISLGKLII